MAGYRLFFLNNVGRSARDQNIHDRFTKSTQLIGGGMARPASSRNSNAAADERRERA